MSDTSTASSADASACSVVNVPTPSAPDPLLSPPPADASDGDWDWLRKGRLLSGPKEDDRTFRSVKKCKEKSNASTRNPKTLKQGVEASLPDATQYRGPLEPIITYHNLVLGRRRNRTRLTHLLTRAEATPPDTEAHHLVNLRSSYRNGKDGAHVNDERIEWPPVVYYANFAFEPLPAARVAFACSSAVLSSNHRND
eukprot:1189058-Prorocentrum_minimum.AAC.2